jgi:UDP-glucose 4-epimerase
MSATKILVTGVGGYWGGRVAQKLAEDPGYHVMGLDTKAPKDPIPGLDFIQADIRNPLLVELFRSEQVDTVCHLAFQESSRPTEAAFDYNVMGTMKVLGACANSSVSKIIIKSSTAVYGAKASNPAHLSEEFPLAGSRDFGTVRNLMEIEAFCNGFRGQHPEIRLTILRFANIIGPRVISPLTKYLREPISPTLLGFDPIMQLIHEDDVVNSVVHAVRNDCLGVFNIAAQGLMPLSKIVGLAGRVRLPVFHLFAYWGSSLIGSSGLRLSRHTPIELDYIRYRWVADLKKMHEIFQYEPTISAEDALHDFSEQCCGKKYVPEAISRAYDTDLLKRIIERRRNAPGSQAENHQAQQVSENVGDNYE